MSNFSDSLLQSLTLLLQGDTELWQIISLSLQVSLSSTLISCLIGLPLGVLLAIKRFPGHSLVRVLVDTFMALPPVVVGLIAYLLLSRSGPLGIWGLLYTPAAMIIAQSLLITPLMIALSLQTFDRLWGDFGDQIRLLHLSPRQTLTTLFHEGRTSLSTTALAGFGRAIAEIGAVMMVGGNIEHHTRVMTTAIAMETSRGNLELALALGIVLLLIALGINSSVHLIQRLSVHRRQRLLDDALDREEARDIPSNKLNNNRPPL